MRKIWVSEAGNNFWITNILVDNSEETGWNLPPETQLICDLK